MFDLAAAGAVGFRAWATLEPISPLCTCEIEAARDSDVVPGYDTLNRAWLASALLVLSLVLFTTGYTRDAIIHQGRLDPGAELIGKPFTYATLVARIQCLLRRAA